MPGHWQYLYDKFIFHYIYQHDADTFYITETKLNQNLKTFVIIVVAFKKQSKKIYQSIIVEGL